ncbi:MAG: cellulase family glycosylhydrolase [Candidatus Omnitrophica bacterium]|nr:cellulase family glycosylhydrolase [Candidatus Omnitrophota bacterium]
MKVFYRIIFCLLTFSLATGHRLLATEISVQQTEDLEFNLDVDSSTITLPKVFRPALDLSGRGFHQQANWPQNLAAKEVLDSWQQDIGFGSIYRLQYNLWEINQLSKDPATQKELLDNYDSLLKKINDAGGIVILDIFGTPFGLSKGLDKRVPPTDLKKFKELIKETIRELSCKKRYSIWYEVWNAPDLDDFFLGRKQDYLNLYQQVAEAARELEAETKIHIPVGGPSTSWWFQGTEDNNIMTPEKGLLYELIKFCYHYRLPLDFISWHAYSTDPRTEDWETKYKKNTVSLIRDWLSYFGFNRNTPLVVDEWNFDRQANILPERKEQSYITASFIPARIENMYRAGLDYQVYFCLEDFQDNKEAVARNVGIFSFEPGQSVYKGAPKAIYNAFRMLGGLGNQMYQGKFKDEFVGIIATKTADYTAFLVYNYIDPEIATNFLSKEIAAFNDAERKFLLNLIKQEKLNEILSGKTDISKLRASNKIKSALKKAAELDSQAKKFQAQERTLKIGLKNLKGVYIYQRYTIDPSCSLDCVFAPSEEKEITADDLYQETLVLKPYSTHLLIWKPKPVEPIVSDTPKVTDAEQKE